MLFLFLWAGAFPVFSLDSIVLPRPQSSIDDRDAYNIELLKLALESTKVEYGDYSVRLSDDQIPTRRLSSLVRDQDQVNLMFSPTTKELESELLPVYFPLDKGLLGYRLLLIRKQDRKKFASVKNLNDFMRFSVGQGLGWGDVEIFRNAGIRVVTGDHYEGLFAMLMGHRFDCFSRSISEALNEYRERKAEYPDLVIEDGLVIVYPYPNYIFVSKNNPRLARRLKQGLETLLANGTLDKVFLKYNQEAFAAARLRTRRVLRLENPNLPLDTPTRDLIAQKKYWFDPLR
jgi:hypothetical protein